MDFSASIPATRSQPALLIESHTTDLSSRRLVQKMILRKILFTNTSANDGRRNLQFTERIIHFSHLLHGSGGVTTIYVFAPFHSKDICVVPMLLPGFHMTPLIQTIRRRIYLPPFSGIRHLFYALIQEVQHFVTKIGLDFNLFQNRPFLFFIFFLNAVSNHNTPFLEKYGTGVYGCFRVSEPMPI